MLTIIREAKQHDGDAFHRLRSVPGIGKVLALTILYEIHDITRFDRVQEFASYARLVKGAHISAGKVHGSGGAKMGNVHLKWAFSEAAVLFLRHAPRAKTLLGAIEKKHGKGKALSILAHKIFPEIPRSIKATARGPTVRGRSPNPHQPGRRARQVVRLLRFALTSNRSLLRRAPRPTPCSVVRDSSSSS